MADYSIAIKIAGELASSFKSALKGAQSGLSGLAGIAGKLGGAAMKGAAVGIGAASTAAIGLGTTAVNVGKEFESAMSQVSATMLLDQGTEKGKAAFQTLEDAARECGASTAFSATEAAEGLNYLALAGYDAEKAAAALPTVLKLAGAGAMGLSDASDMVTDAMSALNIEATHYKPKFHHVYTIPSFHIMLNFFYFTSSIYTIKSRLRQGVRGDGRGSKPD